MENIKNEEKGKNILQKRKGWNMIETEEKQVGHNF